MKTNISLKTTALLLCALFTAPAALAAQFGVNLGATDGDGEADFSGSPIVAEFDVQTQQLNFAMNACETCRWFNYRLNLGYTRAELDYGRNPFTGTTVTDDADGLNITNTFGLKLVNGAGFKFWIGASVYLAGMAVDGDISDDETASVWGVGPTIGMDFRTPEGVTLSLELGARDLEVDINTDALEDYEIEDTSLRLSVLF